MRPSTIRLLTLAICATAVVPEVAVTDAQASSRHIQKHYVRQSLGFRNSWAAGEVRTAARLNPPGGDVCRGSARSFDCRTWPPPIGDDPDRKMGDGGP
jgi:hypothetical protein